MNPRFFHTAGVLVGTLTCVLLFHVAISRPGDQAVGPAAVRAKAPQPCAEADLPKTNPAETSGRNVARADRETVDVSLAAATADRTEATTTADLVTPVPIDVETLSADLAPSLTETPTKAISELLTSTATGATSVGSLAAPVITILPASGGASGGSSGGATGASSGGSGGGGFGGSSGGASRPQPSGGSSATDTSSDPAQESVGTQQEPTSTTGSGGGSTVIDRITWDDPAVLETLQSLSPLPKVHYYWYPPTDLLNSEDNPVLRELARITHTICISGDWTNEVQVDNAVRIAGRLNRDPHRPFVVSLGVTMAPWHRRLDPGLPPTDRGPSYYAELEYFQDRLTRVKEWVQRSNAWYGTTVTISALLLDSERWATKLDDPAWNAGIRQALDAITQRAQAVLPNAKLIWFNHGMALTGPTLKCHLSSWWTGQEITSVLTCALYEIPEPERTEALLQANVDLADQMGIADVIPYVALASGYDLQRRWRSNWNYDPSLSRRFGVAFHSDRAPYNRAPAAVFYPAPFDRRAQHWFEHFVAYVKGATTGRLE